mgnify:CR=1 FL=1
MVQQPFLLAERSDHQAHPPRVGFDKLSLSGSWVYSIVLLTRLTSVRANVHFPPDPVVQPRNDLPAA